METESDEGLWTSVAASFLRALPRPAVGTYPHQVRLFNTKASFTLVALKTALNQVGLSLQPKPGTVVPFFRRSRHTATIYLKEQVFDKQIKIDGVDAILSACCRRFRVSMTGVYGVTNQVLKEIMEPIGSILSVYKPPNPNKAVITFTKINLTQAKKELQISSGVSINMEWKLLPARGKPRPWVGKTTAPPAAPSASAAQGKPAMEQEQSTAKQPRPKLSGTAGTADVDMDEGDDECDQHETEPAPTSTQPTPLEKDEAEESESTPELSDEAEASSDPTSTADVAPQEEEMDKSPLISTPDEPVITDTVLGYASLDPSFSETTALPLPEESVADLFRVLGKRSVLSPPLSTPSPVETRPVKMPQNELDVTPLSSRFSRKEEKSNEATSAQ